MTAREFPQWHVWWVDWTHEDVTHYASSQHPALIISRADQIESERIVRFLKMTGTPREGPNTIRFAVGEPLATTLKLTKDTYLYLDCEQHLPPSKPPCLHYRGGPLNQFTIFYVKKWLAAQGYRPLYAITAPIGGWSTT